MLVLFMSSFKASDTVALLSATVSKFEAVARCSLDHQAPPLILGTLIGCSRAIIIMQDDIRIGDELGAVAASATLIKAVIVVQEQ